MYDEFDFINGAGPAKRNSPVEDIKLLVHTNMNRAFGKCTQLLPCCMHAYSGKTRDVSILFYLVWGFFLPEARYKPSTPYACARFVTKFHEERRPRQDKTR